MRKLAYLQLSALFVCGVLAPPAIGSGQLDDFNAARRTLQQQLRSKQPADRMQAIKKLQEFPIAESVKLVCNAQADADSEVREAAFRTLLELANHQEVYDAVLLLAKKAVHHKDQGETAAPLLAALLSAKSPKARRDAIDFVDKTAAGKTGLPVILTLADALGEHHEKEDVVPLVALSESKTFAKTFALRRAIVHALAKIPHREAVGALIGMVDKLHGEAQADAVEHLTEVTEQIFALESKAWQEWWKTAGETFEYPSRSLQSPYRSVTITASDYYYGLPLFAERLVFVLDTSGSMAKFGRIMAAKRELVQAINNLPPHVSFGVVVFNNSVSVWQRQLVPANEQTKRAAVSYVNSQSPHADTASYDALESALTFDTEAIYFLSDGAPTGGKIVAPEDIITTITAINKSRRISIYTIGIGAGFPGSPLDVFLKVLAEKNLGLYRRVDQ